MRNGPPTQIHRGLCQMFRAKITAAIARMMHVRRLMEASFTTHATRTSSRSPKHPRSSALAGAPGSQDIRQVNTIDLTITINVRRGERIRVPPRREKGREVDTIDNAVVIQIADA